MLRSRLLLMLSGLLSWRASIACVGGPGHGQQKDFQTANYYF